MCIQRVKAENSDNKQVFSEVYSSKVLVGGFPAYGGAVMGSCI